MKQYFSDFFSVSPKALDAYGAFNISLISDLPLFIDPFLLFNSRKRTYQKLHGEIINYIKFLRDRSADKALSDGAINAWFRFPEIKQNWFGFSVGDNRGSGLGRDFAKALHANLHKVFHNFGEETVTQGSHIEKLCLISDGVGRDNISDFTTNLIHGFLLDYTQRFAKKHIKPRHRKTIPVKKAKFNYKTETWEAKTFDLPFYNDDYVLLTPKDILTRDETWINKSDYNNNFDVIIQSVPNDALRIEINNYFYKVLEKDRKTKEPKETKKAKAEAAARTYQQFPELVDYYLKYKEDNGDKAVDISAERVQDSQQLYVEQFQKLAALLDKKTDFYKKFPDTLDEARQRVFWLKQVIENQDGYRFFYRSNGARIDREQDLQLLYALTWFATESDVNREVNNGRGPVDFKVSRGSRDKSLVEFKLAKNTQLEKNLEKQLAIYEAANNTKKSLTVILFLSEDELLRVESILRRLKLTDDEDIILIDARNDNKPSGSKA